MFKKFLGKKVKKSEVSDQEREILERIEKMNLTDMKSYINNNLKDFPLTSYGLNAVLKRLITPDASTQKLYISADDMDTKKKKAFELVLSTMSKSKITVESMELVRQFIETYENIIEAYDREYKQIYTSRFQDALEVGARTLDKLLEMSQKRSVLK